MTPLAVLALMTAGNCPWLNNATAGGVLGGDPVAIETETGCTFTREQAALRIEVRTVGTARNDLTSYGARCSSQPEPLRGIGNEAIACTLNRGQQVIGRVRGSIFVISFHCTGSLESQRAKTRLIAEQVAGNLF